jgi:hypothetical protein
MILAVLSLSLWCAVSQSVSNGGIDACTSDGNCVTTYLSTMTAWYNCQILVRTNCTNIESYLPSLLFLKIFLVLDSDCLSVCTRIRTRQRERDRENERERVCVCVILAIKVVIPDSSSKYFAIDLQFRCVDCCKVVSSTH